MEVIPMQNPNPSPRVRGPVIYWRVVGVALVTAALSIMTTIFAIKAWANGKQADASAPDTAAETALLPEPADTKAETSVPIATPEEKPQPTQKKEEIKIAPGYPEKPELDAPKPLAKPDEKKTEVACIPEMSSPPRAKAPAIFKRRDFRTEEELRKELVQVPIFRTSKVTAESLRKLAKAPKDKKFTATMMPDFAGLPMQMGVDCQLGKEPAENLHVLSQKLRAGITASCVPGANDPRPNPTVLRTFLSGQTGQTSPVGVQGGMIPLQTNPAEWLQPEAVPTLMQMLMAENKPIRLLLVEWLALNPSREAGIALAQRALFDLSPEVREAAVQALKTRPMDQYRDKLVDGFRYPWTPVNDHAAEALVALDAKETIVDLVKLLDQSAPTTPSEGKPGAKSRVAELVRINHLANCAFCHPRSFTSTDLVRGQIPDPNQSVSPGSYQQARSMMSFVRANETYLRQDFSVTQPVSNPGPWPAFQRFDYVVRHRPLTLDEEIFGRPMDTAPEQQRQALLFALREITGRDAGKTALSWRRLMAEVEKPAPNGLNGGSGLN
jgi:hypothetical protein